MTDVTKIIKDLRTYVDRELHEKRFLQDASDLLKSIDGLSTVEREARIRIIHLNKDIDGLAGLKQKLSEDVEKVEEANAATTAAALEEARVIKQKADEYKKQREKEADAYVEGARAKLDGLNAAIQERESIAKVIDRDIKEQEQKLEALKDEQAKLLKKFGG